MKLLTIYVFVSFLLLFVGGELKAKKPIIDDEAVFLSPDKKFSAKLFYSDDQYYMSVKDNRTGKCDRSAKVLSPVFSIRWTGDSKTIVTVEHLSGGSVAGIIHFNGESWHSFDAFLPDTTGHYEVVKEDLGFDTVRLEYKGTKERENGLVVGFYLYSFDLNPNTNALKNIVKKEINQETYNQIESSSR